MPTIQILPSEFDDHQRLQLAQAIKAGFPSPAEDYHRDSLDFNRDLIKHPEATFYGRVQGDSMTSAMATLLSSTGQSRRRMAT